MNSITGPNCCAIGTVGKRFQDIFRERLEPPPICARESGGPNIVCMHLDQGLSRLDSAIYGGVLMASRQQQAPSRHVPYMEPWHLNSLALALGFGSYECYTMLVVGKDVVHLDGKRPRFSSRKFTNSMQDPRHQLDAPNHPRSRSVEVRRTIDRPDTTFSDRRNLFPARHRAKQLHVLRGTIKWMAAGHQDKKLRMGRDH